MCAIGSTCVPCICICVNVCNIIQRYAPVGHSTSLCTTPLTRLGIRDKVCFHILCIFFGVARWALELITRHSTLDLFTRYNVETSGVCDKICFHILTHFLFSGCFPLTPLTPLRRTSGEDCPSQAQIRQLSRHPRTYNSPKARGAHPPPSKGGVGVLACRQ